MNEKEALQTHLYEQLSASNIAPISARYLAFRFQELKAKNIVDVLTKTENEYVITTDIKKYVVTLPMLPIPDASIKEIRE